MSKPVVSDFVGNNVTDDYKCHRDFTSEILTNIPSAHQYYQSFAYEHQSMMVHRLLSIVVDVLSQQYTRAHLPVSVDLRVVEVRET